MKRILRSFIPLLFFQSCVFGQQTTPSKPKDVDGWTKAHWGMTKAEVLKAFPEAHSASSGKVIVSAPFKIGDDQFTAEFDFSEASNLLDTVIISTDRKILLDDLFQELELMLTEKYGSPTTRADPSLQDKEVISTNWAFPNTIISLNRMRSDVLMSMNLVTITYHKNQARKASGNL